MARARLRNVYIEGAEELARMFGEMTEVAEEILQDAVKPAAEFVMSEAKRRCPVRTGALRNSIDMKLEKTRKTTKKYWRIYSKSKKQGGVNYAFAVEGGVPSRGIAARPFMRPALDENEARVKEIIKENLTRLLGAVR